MNDKTLKAKTIKLHHGKVQKLNIKGLIVTSHKKKVQTTGKLKGEHSYYTTIKIIHLNSTQHP